MCIEMYRLDEKMYSFYLFIRGKYFLMERIYSGMEGIFGFV
uniref:Uncharacterized protein n=1 Tax=Candidatus Kentrum sp. MB TaxID=2138164 RepID=A0A451BD11_9GAMM|nr:MAG: hypothetical protein BECKMB1821G_GA0114241_10569 [Candidatus Kentron sp. MB]VFK31925.1 MAG: hypothetical protein BECKMB1821I_GA0114274_102816 [Candidatus Kentron sp. MB]VFK76176.1 MAG: hypothetical protein BECKMB1821H_GA0114242_10458 [Candidatus Kentron sp. MB]